MEENSIQELKKELISLKEEMKEIKAIALKIEELEQSEIKGILKLHSMEEAELKSLEILETLEKEELDKLHKLHPKKFRDITAWKSLIWDNCKEKVMRDSTKVVSFYCNLNNTICSFEICPKNMLTDEKNTK